MSRNSYFQVAKSNLEIQYPNSTSSKQLVSWCILSTSVEAWGQCYEGLSAMSEVSWSFCWFQEVPVLLEAKCTPLHLLQSVSGIYGMKLHPSISNCKYVESGRMTSLPYSLGVFLQGQPFWTPKIIHILQLEYPHVHPVNCGRHPVALKSCMPDSSVAEKQVIYIYIYIYICSSLKGLVCRNYFGKTGKSWLKRFLKRISL